MQKEKFQEVKDFVQNNVGQYTQKEMAAELGVGLHFVKKAVNEMGLINRGKNVKGYMSIKEREDYPEIEAFIKANKSKYSMSEYARKYNVSLHQIEKLFVLYGLKKPKKKSKGEFALKKREDYSEIEKYVLENCGKISRAVMAKKFDTDITQIANVLNFHNIRLSEIKKSPFQELKESDNYEEIKDYVRKNYKSISRNQMGKHLNLSKHMMNEVFKDINLLAEVKKPTKPITSFVSKRKDYKEIEDFVAKNYNSISQTAIGKKFGISRSQVKLIMDKLNLKSDITKSLEEKNKNKKISTKENHKYCNTCLKELPLDDFPKNRNTCNKCRRQRQLDLIKKRGY